MQIAQVKEVLEKTIPDLCIDKVEEMAHGWRNYVFLINGSLIVRFPKVKKTDLNKQKQILDLLSDKISFELPKIYYLDLEHCYAIYPAILACSYNRQSISTFNQTEKNNLAEDLADFLRQMHQALSTNDHKKLKIDQFDYLKEITDIAGESKQIQKLDLGIDLKEFIQEQSEISSEYLSRNFEEVLLHNDLHSSNIILDCDKKKLQGVIDFDEMKVGHYDLDFVSLVYSLPFEVTKKIAQFYSDLTGRLVHLDYAKAIAVDYVSSNLVKFPKSRGLWLESVENLQFLQTIPVDFS